MEVELGSWGETPIPNVRATEDIEDTVFDRFLCVRIDVGTLDGGDEGDGDEEGRGMGMRTGAGSGVRFGTVDSLCSREGEGSSGPKVRVEQLCRCCL